MFLARSTLRHSAQLQEAAQPAKYGGSTAAPTTTDFLATTNSLPKGEGKGCVAVPVSRSKCVCVCAHTWGEHADEHAGEHVQVRRMYVLAGVCVRV